MDRRIRKSKEALQGGLRSLLQRIPFDDITIQNITNEADTARVTFYRHYATKEELLLDIVETTQQQLREYEEANPSSFDDILNFDNVPPTFFFYSMLAENRFAAKNISSSSAQNLLRKAIYQTTVERIMVALDKSPHYADLPAQFISHHIAVVNCGYIFWWVLEDFPYSTEYVARLTHYAGVCGALKIIGRDDLIKMPLSDIWDFQMIAKDQKRIGM